MPRYAFKIEYDGKPFSGWQRQNAQPSVQGSLETALARLEPGEHAILAAGRTDAGVHATGQVAHCDLTQEWQPFRLMEALNYHLKPAPISIVACALVPDDWHARFSALERQYLFRVVARRAPVTHDEGLVWQVKQPLDLDAMQRAVKYLIGHHDFTTFRATGCQAKSPVKTLGEGTVEQLPYPHGAEFQFRFRARSFLYNQVRSMVGSLERVGCGTWAAKDIDAALKAKDRTACGPVSPPHGLYLTGVSYPTNVFA